MSEGWHELDECKLLWLRQNIVSSQRDDWKGERKQKIFKNKAISK